MTHRALLILSILLLTTDVFCQTRIITGKIIDDELNPVYQARINNIDTTQLASTDVNGDFKINISTETQSLIISCAGMEWKLINLSTNCDHLELIMLNAGTYDFMSAGKVDRLRKKYFDTLPELHQSAYAKGIFRNDKPCYVDNFISVKKKLKETHKSRTQMPGT